MGETYSIYQGDAATMVFTLKRTNGKPVDLANATAVTIVVLPDVDDEVATPFVVGQCKITDGVKMQVTYTFTATDTATYGMCPIMFIVTSRQHETYTIPDLDDMWLWIKKKGY